MTTFNFKGKQYNISELTRPQRQTFLGLFKDKHSKGDAVLTQAYILGNQEEIKKLEDMLTKILAIIKELEK